LRGIKIPKEKSEQKIGAKKEKALVNQKGVKRGFAVGFQQWP